MKKIFKKIEKWFDFNIAWFLINGSEHKQEKFRQYMIEKYPEEFKEFSKNKK
mgnify:CR=1 FL=1